MCGTGKKCRITHMPIILFIDRERYGMKNKKNFFGDNGVGIVLEAGNRGIRWIQPTLAY